MREATLRDGGSLPVLGLGTWRMGEDPAARAEEVYALQYGIDIGMTMIDTAEMYGAGGAEEVVGEAIAGRRDGLILVSKVLPENASYSGTIAACERSLRRMKSDVIDLYLLHWRGKEPLREAMEAFLDLQHEGKIKRFGVSNLDLNDMAAWLSCQGDDPVSIKRVAEATAVNQVEYNLGSRGIDFDLLPWHRQAGIPVMAYCPLAQGNISGSGVVSWQGEEKGATALLRVAAHHGVTPQQIMLAWVLRGPGVLAVAKSTKPARLRQNLRALDIQLSAEDLADLDSEFPAPTRPVPLAMP